MVYSDNIIFFDTEFTNIMNVRECELLSIGLVKMTGEELYLEIEYTGEPHEWVKEKVLPYLEGNPISAEEARKRLADFIGDDEPYLMAYVNQFDAVMWYDLFGSPQEHPCYWIPLDFASILFAHGYSPNSMGKHAFFEEMGVDKDAYNQHNALDDARMLKEVYLAFLEKEELSTKN